MLPLCDSPGGLVVKNLPAHAGDLSSIPGSGKSPEVGNSSPRWYSCLENSMDRGAWRAAVHEVTKSWTRLSDWAHRPHFKGSGFETQDLIFFFFIL